MSTQYRYEAANANGTFKKVFATKEEADEFAQEKLYDYPTYAITPTDGEVTEDEKAQMEDED